MWCPVQSKNSSLQPSPYQDTRIHQGFLTQIGNTESYTLRYLPPELRRVGHRQIIHP